MKHAIRFLDEGNRVKAVVQFRGREIAHTDLGRKLLQRFAQDLSTHGLMEGQPKLEGRNAHVIISPIKKEKDKPKEKDKEKGEGPAPSAPPPPPAAQ
jgi:translation initiation factor IF-3